MEELHNYKNQYDNIVYIEESKNETISVRTFDGNSVQELGISGIDGSYNKETNIFTTDNTENGVIVHLTKIVGFVEGVYNGLLKVVFSGQINYDILLETKIVISQVEQKYIIRDKTKEVGDNYTIVYFDVSNIPSQYFQSYSTTYSTYIIKYIKPYFNNTNTNIQSYERLGFNATDSFFMIKSNMIVHRLPHDSFAYALHKNRFLNSVSDSFIDLSSLDYNIILLDPLNHEIHMKANRELNILNKVLIPIKIKKSKCFRKYYTVENIPNPSIKAVVILETINMPNTSRFFIVYNNKIYINDNEEIQFELDRFNEFTIYEMEDSMDTDIIIKTFYSSDNPSQLMLSNFCNELDIQALIPSNQVSFLEKNKKYKNFVDIKKRYDTYNIDIPDSSDKQIMQKKMQNPFKMIKKEV